MRHERGRLMSLCTAAITATACMLVSSFAVAHHSFAMYDRDKVYVLTGVVTRVNPGTNHLQIFFGVLDHARKTVIRDDSGEPIIWTVELRAAGQVARDGVTVDDFPPGTIFSVGLHPLRNGLPGGGRAEFGLFKCPERTPPSPGKHCDSVQGATSHGQGALPEPTQEWPERN